MRSIHNFCVLKSAATRPRVLLATIPMNGNTMKYYTKFNRLHLSLLLKRKGYKTSERSLTWAQFLCVWTSLSEEEFSCLDILEIYRWRWQVELIFKRAKSLMELKHLPTTRKRATAEAWLQGKFLYIMLVELLVERASSFSPWGEGPLAEVHVGPVCALT